MKLTPTSKIKAGWRVKLISGFLLLLAVLFGFSLFKSWQNNHEINHEISSLHQNINSIEQENAQLKQLIDYFNSSAYIEEKARTDLGLKKNGEKVVVVPKIDQLNASSTSTAVTSSQATTNPGRWWHNFFK